ncbi:hypothetical protein GCM10007207_25210 [Asaia siamensis]|uniref:Uncharacterized protein n=2 Tax=Asaia siamensis TaxID=110479 RepID=A0ABQ1MF36_9PROT|nr:hypothetical protein AA0323_0399 [Asaia siamensis NRIC 0323]GGC38679.1 hypothetical protein GCM10007207_25210 [Asaia siamensis]
MGRTGGMRAAFLLLTALALMVRLAGTPPQTGVATDDPLGTLAALSVLCETPSPDDPDHRHHDTTLSDGAMLLSLGADISGPALALMVPQRGIVLFVHSVGFWCFPPVRGPPEPARDSRSPQGPPVST